MKEHVGLVMNSQSWIGIRKNLIIKALHHQHFELWEDKNQDSFLLMLKKLIKIRIVMLQFNEQIASKIG